MENKGFIQLNRAVLNWQWYGNINVFKLFIHCLLKANYIDKEWQDITVKRGSFVTSREHLAKETGLTEQNVRTALKKLISTKYLTKYSTAKYTIITVVSYDEWTKANQVTNQQTTTTNKDNKYFTTQDGRKYKFIKKED